MRRYNTIAKIFFSIPVLTLWTQCVSNIAIITNARSLKITVPMNQAG